MKLKSIGGVLLGAVALIVVAGCALPTLSEVDGAITSTFDADPDGWQTTEDAVDAPTPAVDLFESSIHATDGGSGIYWYFSAPSKFLGSKESFYGGTLEYELKMRTSDVSSSHSEPEVQLEGTNGVVLELDLGILPNPNDWTRFSADLSTTADWTVESTGLAATETQIRAVLADLDALRICGEYNVGADSAALWYVRLLPQ